MGNKDKAIEYLQLYTNWKDTLYNQENANAIAEMQTKYETEKKDNEYSLLLAEKKLDKAEIRRKSTMQIMLLLGLLIALVVVAYVVYSLNQKKKTNKILNAQNEEITEQHFIIEEKNKDITDSLNYAQRIQDAILPEESLLNKSHEAFIYYRPKDIVSGDFYWMKEIGDKIYFSVVDCTGHGVSGAFMSIIGINSLNKIVDDLKIESTGKILDELNKSVNTALGVNHADENSIVNIRDGMDICICSIDKSTNNLEYSGANNSLYLIRNKENLIKERDCILDNDQSIFYEIKPDKMAIGGGSNKVKYKTHSIQLKKDDTLYLFSDGYADQFGGTKGKKFMYKPFKRMFLSIQDQSMDSQLSHIDKTMREWKMGIEQLDDICVMGVRV
jgi:serine phosphatase RsbU (regulator of sigma subunit)